MWVGAVVFGNGKKRKNKRKEKGGNDFVIDIPYRRA
jgi:hypothetical protein